MLLLERPALSRPKRAARVVRTPPHLRFVLLQLALRRLQLLLQRPQLVLDLATDSGASTAWWQAHAGR